VRVALRVGDFLRRAALVAPERIAVVDEAGVAGSLGEVNYGQLARRAAALASKLDQLEIAHGARVAIISPNSAKFLISFFGVSGYGRVLVPINFRLNAEEVHYIVEHSGAEVVLYDPELSDVVADLDGPLTVCLNGVDDVDWFNADFDRPEPLHWDGDEDATCSINYTSGTTARPKGVQLTHRNCWLNASTFGWHVGVSDRDVLLHTLPMFHANGWGMPYAATAMAARHIVLRKIDGEEILQRIDNEKVTLLCCAPAVIAMTLEAASARVGAGRAVPGRGEVRIVVAGAPPPRRTIERVEAELGWEFIQIYGLTETSPLLTINRAPAEWDDLDPSERASRLSRAGVPAVGVEITVDVDGEVLARSNHVFESYWNQPIETEKALEGGWFHTGDGGVLDGAFTVITDRKKDVIITGGENVSSIEVEDCLFSHPAVAEVAVIGVPDEKWGETIKALVVVRSGTSTSEAELIEHCRQHLAHFKAPRSVEFRDELARTATGKLQKFKLREPYWADLGRNVN
jgi:acyl-CoA synthetase (AMP-forming)/AMP-acid ligase II